MWSMTTNPFDELLDQLFAPLTECCGKIPSNRPEGSFCHYCQMSMEWCQCEASDFCSCEP